MNRKGLIFFLVFSLSAVLLLIGQAILSERSEDRPLWETATESPLGTPAEQSHANALLKDEIAKLKTLQNELVQSPETDVVDQPKEDLTEGLFALREPVEKTYPDLREILSSYPEVRRRWQTQVERTLARKDDADFKLPDLPNYQKSLYEIAAGSDNAENYRKLYGRVYDKYRSHQSEFFADHELEVVRDFQKLLTLHRLRSSYLETMIKSLGHDAPLAITPDQGKMLSLEMRLVSYRYRTFFAVKRGMIREDLLNGVVGWLGLLRQLGQLLFAVFLPFATYWFLRAFSQWLGSSQKDRIALHPSVRLFLRVLPWLGSLVVLTPIRNSLDANLALMELAVIPGVAIFVIYYQVGVQLVGALFLYLLRGMPRRSRGSVGLKTQKTVRLVVGAIVGMNLFLYLVKCAIGKALIYWLLDSVKNWLGLAVFLIVSALWKPLLPDLALATLGTSFRRHVKIVTDSPLGWLAAPFVLLVIVAITLLLELVSFGRRFDWFNEALATLVRQRAQTSNRISEEVPAPYIEAFRSLDSSQSNRSLEDAYAKVTHVVDEFVTQGRASATIVLSGPRGSGKVRILERLSEAYQDKLDVRRLDLEARITEERELITKIASAILDEELEDVEQLVERLENAPPKLVVLRGAHNLFLSRVGGFETLKSLSRLSCLTNLLFCLCFEPHSWRFVQGALPDGTSDPVVVDLQRLRPNEIRELILQRHQATGFELLYDSTVLGGGFDSEDTSNFETAFFQILWDTSEGVPGIAEEVWLNSLELVEEGVVRARTPKMAGLSKLNGLNQETLFLFAALYRHETLSVEEAAVVTDLPVSLTDQVFRLATQKALLVPTPQGYQVSSLWYAPLARFLRRKNHLYGR
jgi:hypothetical protein